MNSPADNDVRIKGLDVALGSQERYRNELCEKNEKLSPWSTCNLRALIPLVPFPITIFILYELLLIK